MAQFAEGDLYIGRAGQANNITSFLNTTGTLCGDTVGRGAEVVLPGATKRLRVGQGPADIRVWSWGRRAALITLQPRSLGAAKTMAQTLWSLYGTLGIKAKSSGSAAGWATTLQLAIRPVAASGDSMLGLYAPEAVLISDISVYLGREQTVWEDMAIEFVATRPGYILDTPAAIEAEYFGV